MDSANNGRWIIPLKKIGMVSVKQEENRKRKKQKAASYFIQPDMKVKINTSDAYLH